MLYFVRRQDNKVVNERNWIMSHTAHATNKGRILSVEVKREVDCTPDLSEFGKYTDEATDWAIIRIGEHAGTFVHDLPEDAELPQRGRAFRFFIPPENGEELGSADFCKYAKQDYKRMEAYNNMDWCLYGIMAFARVTFPGSDVIQRIRSGGVWGIESDSGSWLDEVAQDELDALRWELKNVRFGKRAIAQAFKNIKMPD